MIFQYSSFRVGTNCTHPKELTFSINGTQSHSELFIDGVEDEYVVWD